MVRLDEKAFNFLRYNGLTLEGETKEDLEVRIEISDALERGLIDSNEKLESDIGTLFAEIGKEATADDIERIKGNIVKKRKSHLVENIIDFTRVVKYQPTADWKGRLEAAQEEFDRLEADPNSFYENIFKQKNK